jgi:hypothetical protein
MKGRRVYKYNLEWTDRQSIELPLDAQILDVEIQSDEQLKLWALFTPQKNLPFRTRYIRIAGTGHDISDDIIWHIKTIHNRQFVWHIFETLPPHVDPGD